MIVLELAAIALGALAMAGAVHAGSRDLVIGRERPRRARRADPLPAQLARLESLVNVPRAGEVHQRLRPLLRPIAASRLRRHGVALDVDVDAARRLLGEELWEIVRPQRPLPEDRFGPGLSSADLHRLIERLEAL